MRSVKFLLGALIIFALAFVVDFSPPTDSIFTEDEISMNVDVNAVNAVNVDGEVQSFVIVTYRLHAMATGDKVAQPFIAMPGDRDLNPAQYAEVYTWSSYNSEQTPGAEQDIYMLATVIRLKNIKPANWGVRITDQLKGPSLRT